MHANSRVPTTELIVPDSVTQQQHTSVQQNQGMPHLSVSINQKFENCMSDSNGDRAPKSGSRTTEESALVAQSLNNKMRSNERRKSAISDILHVPVDIKREEGLIPQIINSVGKTLYNM